MSAVPVRPHAGEPAADRISARRARLVATAFALLADDGWRDVRIDALCRRAGLNKRYFYESFATLDDVVAAVVDDTAADLLAVALAAVAAGQAAGETTPELTRRVLGAAIGHLVDDPRRARVLFAEVAGSPAAIARRRAAIAGLAGALSDFGHEHHGAGGATDPIATVASAVLVGGSAEAVLAWLDDPVVPQAQLVDDLSDLWVAVGDRAAERARARAR